VLNEDEHHIKPDMGQAYTVCFDAIKARPKRAPSFSVFLVHAGGFP
jgi:hypothetical protein